MVASLLQIVQEGSDPDVGWMVYRLIVSEVQSKFSNALDRPTTVHALDMTSSVGALATDEYTAASGGEVPPPSRSFVVSRKHNHHPFVAGLSHRLPAAAHPTPATFLLSPAAEDAEDGDGGDSSGFDDCSDG